jgi:hypothetical protein
VQGKKLLPSRLTLKIKLVANAKRRRRKNKEDEI